MIYDWINNTEIGYVEAYDGNGDRIDIPYIFRIDTETGEIRSFAIEKDGSLYYKDDSYLTTHHLITPPITIEWCEPQTEGGSG